MSVFVSLINPQNSIIDYIFSSFNPDSELNKKYWLKVKDSYFFVVKKFNSADSIKILNALATDKKNLIFDDTGNIGYKEFKFINPLVKGPLDYSRTIEDMEKLNPDIYAETSNMVMSQNLQYIMYFKDQIVYILYNPIHRKYLRDYYDGLSPAELGDDGRTFQGTHNIDSVFKTYCDTVADPVTNKYADPTCGCFASFNSCKQNAFLGGNKVDYSDDPNSQNRGILSAIGSNCVCKAPACQYSGILTGDSFLSKYKNNVNSCDGELTISYCSMVNNAAGNVNISNSYLGQDCAKSGYTEIIEDQGLTDNGTTGGSSGGTTDIITDIINGTLGGGSSGSSGGTTGGSSGSSGGTTGGSSGGTTGGSSGSSGGTTGGSSGGTTGGSSGGTTGGSSGSSGGTTGGSSGSSGGTTGGTTGGSSGSSGGTTGGTTGGSSGSTGGITNWENENIKNEVIPPKPYVNPLTNNAFADFLINSIGIKRSEVWIAYLLIIVIVLVLIFAISSQRGSSYPRYY